MKYQNIVWNNNNTPVSIHFDDIYFNNNDAIAECQYVFIDGNHLNQRFYDYQKTIFVVAETGFGSGLNLLVLWQQFLNFKQNNPHHPLKELHFYSIEKYPLSLQEVEQIHQQIIKDASLAKLAKQLQQCWSMNSASFGDIKLNILFNDITNYSHFLTQHNAQVDAWFFDGFSPDKNPDMWTADLFSQLYQLTAAEGTFSTFTAASQVRRNLISAGFQTTKIKGYGKKREMLIGYKSI